ncbi:tRNA (adenosine(37)-N6)-dimethylallyltransferase MiaA [Candidatus Persebacteraceae bacterium Df01]|jgi:tRNA dimethylallyltransferase|uniref:tRNA dimethylallyltransferase n=1 Tax=Candidatus Doriopsillibacter californiensis TaxID=2970740 RepID=A0ABT7QMY3_9GAMM|nr:tRNA (adenosine(37)-N6)-dimethylallyltransferase MiaA [Candidatus Persebacteraceae bacterium Df01]
MTLSALAIAGPTACGKSDIALQVATATNGEIVNVDSGSVYCDMDIGTAKPTPVMRAAVRHHLLDVCPPNESFDAGKFCRLATKAIRDIQARGKLPILTGGTMMYFRALTAGLHQLPPSPPAVRQAIQKDWHTMGAAAIYQRLKALDATTAARLALTDKQRITRALEIVTATGKPLSAWLADDKPVPQLDARFVLLIPSDRKQLRQRIATRLEKMFTGGLVEETQQLIERWKLLPTAPPLRLAGYCQAAAFLRGEINNNTMRDKAYYATCQLAKRQLTWLRHWPNTPTTVDPFSGCASARLMQLTTTITKTPKT